MVMRRSRDVASEAVKWFVRWSDRNEPVGSKEQSRWIAWLQRSPKHVAEYFAVDDLHARLTESGALKDFDVDGWLTHRRAPVIQLNAAPLERALVHARTPDKAWRWSRRLHWGAAAAILVVLGISIVWRLSTTGDSYSTSLGEQKTVQLADGSSLQLNTASTARVKFDERSREIELEGEALFTVAHDARRPFLVYTHGATVRAIGTRFNVYEQEHATRVSVLEGRVRLTSSWRNQSFELGAGEEARVIDGVAHKELKPDVQAATAWRQRTLVFERAKLADVARELNRYNTMRFSVDPAVGDAHRLSGTFDARHPESLLLWLQSRPDMAVTRQGNVYIVRESDKRPTGQE
jgi:transmembrane sensor